MVWLFSTEQLAVCAKGFTAACGILGSVQMRTCTSLDELLWIFYAVRVNE